MNVKGSSDIDEERVPEEDVIAYLRQNSDFFLNHPSLLEQIELTHACGEAISLIEAQVGVLREQNHKLRHRLRELITAARDNEQLSRQLHALTLKLLDCSELERVFSTIYESLRQDFNTDIAVIRLFVAPKQSVLVSGPEFVGDEPEVVKLFEKTLQANQPVCGILSSDQGRYLFDEQPVASAALLPLEASRPIGVLGIGSADPHRFRPNIGTMFLSQLREIVGRIIGRYLIAVE